MLRKLLAQPEKQVFPWALVVGAAAAILVLLFLAWHVYQAVTLKYALRRGNVTAAMCLAPDHRKAVSDPSSLLLLARTPSAATFQAQTCPVCLSTIRRRRRWAQLNCQHGSCIECLLQLVKVEGLESACCLCRAALFQVKGAEGPRPDCACEHEGRLQVPGIP